MLSKKIFFLQGIMLISLTSCWFEKSKSSDSGEVASKNQATDVVDTTVRISTTEQFESLIKNNSNPIVVDFEAPWCSSCRELQPLLLEAANKNPEYTFVRINVDDLPNLGKQYGIIGIPTLLFITKGKEIPESRLIGPSPKNSDELLKEIKNAFAKEIGTSNNKEEVS